MFAEELGSDSDDDDYIPEDGPEVSEEEQSGEEENPSDSCLNLGGKKNKKKVKKVKKDDKPFVRGSYPGETRDWGKELEEEKQEKDEEKEKKKAESLWAEFKSDPVVKKTSEPRRPVGSGLSGLFSSDSGATTEDSAATKVDSSRSKNRFGSLFDPSPQSAPAATETASSTKPTAKSLLSSIFDEPGVKGEPEKVEERLAEKPPGGNSSKLAITKVYDFAGEIVKVTEEVDAESTEAKKFIKSQEVVSKGAKREGGLASVVGSFAKKVKMGCLDKSKLDWNQFVSQEGIKEELSSHNRGKDGYVEKQMFLERADLRQFEKEKEIRDKNRKSLMK